MTPRERRVLEELDRDWLLALLADLVAVRSLGGRETPAQERVAAALREIGADVDQWEIDLEALARHPSFGAEVERAEALGVVGLLGAGDGPRLVFNGHVDVVPAGDTALWRFDPWRATVADGNVYGRGALDMKGGLACALAAARALTRAGVALRGRLLIQTVVGEEDGGTGTLAAVLRGHTGDGAVVVEPTRLAVVPAQAGALNFRLRVPGRSAHACVRDEGVSAIEAFEVVHRALRDFEAVRNAAVDDPLFAGFALPIPLSIGTLQAGDWASTVPESLVAEGRYGIAVGEGLGSARRAFEVAVGEAAAGDPWLRQHPPTVEWYGGQFASAAVPREHHLVGAVAEAFREVSGRAAEIAGVTYGSDMRLLVNEGATPAVLFGPGDVRRAHAPDEYVEIAQLEACARTLALVAMRFCGVVESG